APFAHPCARPPPRPRSRRGRHRPQSHRSSRPSQFPTKRDRSSRVPTGGQSARRVSRETTRPLKVVLTTFVNHSFADTKFAEDHVENVLDVDPTGEPAERCGSRSQLFGNQLLPACVSLSKRAVECSNGVLQSKPMPGAGHQRRLGGGEERFAETSESIDEVIQAGAGTRRDGK